MCVCVFVRVCRTLTVGVCVCVCMCTVWNFDWNEEEVCVYECVCDYSLCECVSMFVCAAPLMQRLVCW